MMKKTNTLKKFYITLILIGFVGGVIASFVTSHPAFSIWSYLAGMGVGGLITSTSIR
jgi:hypothetical protein